MVRFERMNLACSIKLIDFLFCSLLSRFLEHFKRICTCGWWCVCDACGLSGATWSTIEESRIDSGKECIVSLNLN